VKKNHFLREAVTLFRRPPEESYIQELTEALGKQVPTEEVSNKLSVLVFRLGHEWMAIPTIFFKEVAHRRPVHRIPHRSEKILLGVVNLNGRLELYIALHELLQIEISGSQPLSRIPYQLDRMIAISKEGELWVFPVNEIDGIYHWNLSEMENVPITISKSTINYVKGIMNMEHKRVGLIDEELLFSSLKRSIQ
jgi:chemotaxis-related protein WspD